MPFVVEVVEAVSVPEASGREVAQRREGEPDGILTVFERDVRGPFDGLPEDGVLPGGVGAHRTVVEGEVRDGDGREGLVADDVAGVEEAESRGRAQQDAAFGSPEPEV